MTMTMKKDIEGEPEARKLRREFFDDDVLDKLMAATDERGVSLTGEGGFLPEMIKAVLERGMSVELSDTAASLRDLRRSGFGGPGGAGSGDGLVAASPQ